VICSSGIGFDPRVAGKRLTFGFEGIWQGTALLYDHPTRSLWLHLTGTCIEGTYAGTVLKPLGVGRHTTWADWRALHPETDVLARDPRLMGRTDDTGYFPADQSRSGSPYVPRQFLPTIQTTDARLGRNALLYGLVVGQVARAYPFAQFALHPVVEETVGGVAVTVWFDAASRSAAAFRAERDGKPRHFTPAEGGLFRDGETKSLWTMDGLCVRGPQRGRHLDSVPGLMSEWYGWVANHPRTTIWGAR